VTAARAARAARMSTGAIFFLNGAGMGNWVVRIPAVQERLGLGAGRLGLALLGVAAGALVAMPLAGRLVGRHGSRPVTRAAALAFAASLALPALAPSFALLCAALVVLGAANGALDVAMNAQAVAVEREYERHAGRPIMSSFHALFSLGGLAGAAAGGVLAARGVDAGLHLGFAALVAGVLLSGVATGLLPASADAAPGGPAFARPTRALAALGVVAFCVLFGEGAMADWSAVYLRDATGAGPGLAAAGYATFSLAMAAGRSVGDALTVRVGPERLVRIGGAVAATGLAFSLLVARPWAAVTGFGAVGAGLSIVFPTVLAAAGRLPGGAAGAAIAAVSTVGYTGFLAGPPVIGLVAEAVGLRGGLALVVVMAAVIAVLARGLGRGPATDASAAAPAPGLGARAA
jgi:MFS family permease